MANRGKVRKVKEERGLKERLLLKHKRKSLRWGLAARRLWASRTPEDISKLALKISNTLKTQYAQNETFKNANTRQLSAARQNIDREKQVNAAKVGIAKYWADLRNDPIKYAEYKLKKAEASKKCKETLLRKKELEDAKAGI